MLRYYTPDRILAIKESLDYQDLLLVALDVLEDIDDDYPSRPIIQVCGPISTGGTGSRVKNLEIFSRVIERVVSDGLVVFNQMPFEDAMGKIFNSSPDMQGTKLLEEFYLPIFKTNLISMLLFLPGWQNSVGASWEYNQGKKLEIPTICLAEYYIAD